MCILRGHPVVVIASKFCDANLMNKFVGSMMEPARADFVVNSCVHNDGALGVIYSGVLPIVDNTFKFITHIINIINTRIA